MHLLILNVDDIIVNENFFQKGIASRTIRLKNAILAQLVRDALGGARLSNLQIMFASYLYSAKFRRSALRLRSRSSSLLVSVDLRLLGESEDGIKKVETKKENIYRETEYGIRK